MQSYASQLHLPPELRAKIHEYYEYLWHKKNVRGEREMKKLPDRLQLEIAQFVHLEMMRSVPNFAHCPNAFIAACAAKLTFTVCLPLDYVYVAGDRVSGVYIVQRGQVATFGAKKFLFVTGHDHMFGEEEVMCKIVVKTDDARWVPRIPTDPVISATRYLDVWAFSYTDLWLISTPDLVEILESFAMVRQALVAEVISRMNVHSAVAQKLMTTQRTFMGSDQAAAFVSDDLILKKMSTLETGMNNLLRQTSLRDTGEDEDQPDCYD